MKRAVFLDRDGVLTVEKSYVTRVEALEIFPNAKECVRKIHEKGYLAIVITNQSAVGRGLLSLEELEKMNLLLTEQTKVDRIYVCPHWGNGKEVCACRKPGTELVERAMLEYDITASGSYFVGDRASDIETGKRMELCTVLTESGYGTKRLEKEITPDYICEDLAEFVERIL